jgi:cell pole-organizing protein PopZ
MRTIALTNEILPLVIRAIETRDSSLVEEATDMLRPNMTEWLDAETNELIENLDSLITVASEMCDRYQTSLEKDFG